LPFRCRRCSRIGIRQHPIWLMTARFALLHNNVATNGSMEEFVAIAEEMETIVPVAVAEVLLNEGKAA
jgi:hypothetical protein